MMKMAGALLITGMTSIWGVTKAEREKEQLENMKYLQRIMSLIQSEIRYSRAFLGEIFRDVGQGLKEPYKSWLLEMNERTNAFSGEKFEEIWKDCTSRYLKKTAIPEQEFESLKLLGNQMGYAEIQVQMRILDYYQEHLERTIREMYEQMKVKIKLYHCLGVMSGLFVSVLLF